MLVPMVIQQTANGERSMDIFSRLLDERVIIMSGQVSDEMASVISAQLLYLENKGVGDIHIYINSPGGSVTAGMVIYNTMKHLKSDVSTVVTGMAASMGSFLAACGGTKGKRYLLPETEHMIHQPLISGGLGGQADDIMIHAKNIERTRERLERIYAECTGRTYEEVHNACNRDNYMLAKEAVEFGLADEIMYPDHLKQ